MARFYKRKRTNNRTSSQNPSGTKQTHSQSTKVGHNTRVTLTRTADGRLKRTITEHNGSGGTRRTTKILTPKPFNIQKVTRRKSRRGKSRVGSKWAVLGFIAIVLFLFYL